MDRISFDIYIPDGKKFHLTPNWIVYGSWFIALGFLWAFDGVLPNIADFRGYIAGLLAFVSIYYLIISMWTYKALNGKLEGKIVLNEVCFLVVFFFFFLLEISNLDFFFVV